MKRLFFFFVCILAISLVLTGCANPSFGGPTATPTLGVTPTATLFPRCIGSYESNPPIIIEVLYGQKKYYPMENGNTLEVFCQGDSTKSNMTMREIVPIPTTTPAPTATAIEVTSVPANDWVLADPPPPTWYTLPHDLSPDIIYQAPPKDCAVKNDVNETCSVKKGQATKGEITLKKGYVLVSTGDQIDVTHEGTLLAKRPEFSNVHDLWVILNASDKDVKLDFSAPSGSFRGFFTMDGQWDKAHLTHIRDLHLERFLQPKNPDKYTPTPVPNCEDTKNACPSVNVRVVVYDNGTWIKASSGEYAESILWWISK